ncbi:MAG: hypothetical protein V7L26_28185 [Nostoc sp.]|uniref:hypothetical protein n=1 Tax=Nostoc sp. TaxID=1180 RepID=UPI002FF68243
MRALVFAGFEILCVSHNRFNMGWQWGGQLSRSHQRHPVDRLQRRSLVKRVSWISHKREIEGCGENEEELRHCASYRALCATQHLHTSPPKSVRNSGFPMPNTLKN